MKLTSKLSLLFAFAAFFVSFSLAADRSSAAFTVLKVGDTDHLTFNGDQVDFAPGEGEKFLSNLYTFTPSAAAGYQVTSPAYNVNDFRDVVLASGHTMKLTFTVGTAGPGDTRTLVVTLPAAAAAVPAAKTGPKLNAAADFATSPTGHLTLRVGTVGSLAAVDGASSFTAAASNPGLVFLAWKATGNLRNAQAPHIGADGVITQNDANAAADSNFEHPMAKDDHFMQIRTVAADNDAFLTYFKRSPTALSRFMSNGVQPFAAVLFVTCLSAWAFSHIHAYVDPAGYQAGKDASSLPPMLKSLLATASGYQDNYDNDDGGSEEYPGYDQDEDPLSPTPSQAEPRKIVKDDGTEVYVNADGTETPVEEESALGYGSTIAVVLLAPFLL